VALGGKDSRLAGKKEEKEELTHYMACSHGPILRRLRKENAIL